METPTLLPMLQAKELLLKTIKEQIAARQNMMQQMVGSLYQSILADEIDKLVAWRNSIT